MKIVIDEFPERCKKCLFYVPGQEVRDKIYTNSYCSLTKCVVDKNSKGRPDWCPLTEAKK